MREIERKFLVKSEDFIKESTCINRIVQGYLNSNPERTVRVRIKSNKGFITVKGKSSENGISRFEWEKPELLLRKKQRKKRHKEPFLRYRKKSKRNNPDYIDFVYKKSLTLTKSSTFVPN